MWLHEPRAPGTERLHGARRPAAAGLHVLPPEPVDRGAGSAEPAHPRRSLDARGRSCAARARGHDGQAAHPCQAEDRPGAHPLPRSVGRRAAGPAARGARDGLPDLQRGLRARRRHRSRPRRPRGRGDPARAAAARPDAGRGLGHRAAGPDAAAGLPPGGPRRRRRLVRCCSPIRTARCGIEARDPDRGRAGRRGPAPQPGPAGPVRRPGRHRRLPRARTDVRADRLVGHHLLVRRAADDHLDGRGAARTRVSGRRAGRRGQRASRRSTRSRVSTPTRGGTGHGPSCSTGSGGTPRRRLRATARLLSG